MHIAARGGSLQLVAPDDPAGGDDPRRMTHSELQLLGISQLLYLRCGTVDGQPAFAVHAADGSALAVVEDIDLALELAAERSMTFVAVH